ncbi:MAG TPA: hypothetical protein PKD91_02490 [Bacteroidia bacterium]|nr:hypothetical protein [Bacteroidia bacterium]
MKNFKHFIFCVVVYLFSVDVMVAQNMKKEVSPFLEQIVTLFPNVRDIAMNANETEAYFTAQSPLGEVSAIMQTKFMNGVWSKPEVVSFSGMYQDMEPFLSPNGLKLYFVSNRPTDNSVIESKDFDIWFVERKNVSGKWSTPLNMGAPVNTKENEFYPSVALSGNLYFTSDGILSKGKDDIFVCKFKNGKYENPVSVSDSINTDGYEFNAFIAPDESYMLFTCYNRKGGLGSGDLYISYNSGNGQWSGAENLGTAINSRQMDYCPFVQPRTGMLYFTSKRSSLPDQFDENKSTLELLKLMNQYENGWSRLYQVKFNQ